MATSEKNPVKAVPEGQHTVTPFLLADDVKAFIDFSENAFDGEVLYMMKSSDDVIRHATMQIGDSNITISSETHIYGTTPSMLHLFVEDVDTVYRRAINAGAISLRAPRDEFHGDRTGAVKDQWGNQWWIATHIEDLDQDELRRREEKFRLSTDL
jgi:PhnB protein